MILAGRVASVFTRVSVNSIVSTDPELTQTANRPGTPGFHTRFTILTPINSQKRSTVEFQFILNNTVVLS